MFRKSVPWLSLTERMMLKIIHSNVTAQQIKPNIITNLDKYMPFVLFFFLFLAYHYVLIHEPHLPDLWETEWRGKAKTCIGKEISAVYTTNWVGSICFRFVGAIL